MVGILHAELLVGKKADVILLKRHADTVARPSQHEGHIRPGIHRAAGVLESRGMRLIGRYDAQPVATAHCAGIELRQQIPIVGKGRSLLCAGVNVREEEQEQDECRMSKRSVHGGGRVCVVLMTGPGHRQSDGP